MVLKIPAILGPLTNPTITVTSGTIDPNTFAIRISGDMVDSGRVTGTVRDLTVRLLGGQWIVAGIVDTPLTGPTILNTPITVIQASEVISSVIKNLAAFTDTQQYASTLIMALLSKQDIEKYTNIVLNILRSDVVQGFISGYGSSFFVQSILENNGLQSLLSASVPDFDILLQSYKSGSLTIDQFVKTVLINYSQGTGSQLVFIPSNLQRVGKFKVIRHKTAPQYH